MSTLRAASPVAVDVKRTTPRAETCSSRGEAQRRMETGWGDVLRSVMRSFAEPGPESESAVVGGSSREEDRWTEMGIEEGEDVMVLRRRERVVVLALMRWGVLRSRINATAVVTRARRVGHMDGTLVERAGQENWLSGSVDVLTKSKD